VGNDRSGVPLDWESREFLRVIAVHFSNEFHKAELLSTLVDAREAQAFQTFSTFLLHDLKNFATTLSLVARNGARHHGNPEFQADAFQSILGISEKMRRLCANLRTFSTTLAADKKVACINTIVLSVAEMFEASLGRRLQLDLQETPQVFVDREEIARVLQNLVLNAHEASPDDGDVVITTGSIGSRVTISVSDSGHGIPREFLEKMLFQPFQTTKPDGLGIGLFQCKKIVEAHDGAVEIESREGTGTVVRVILPAVTDAAPAVEAWRLSETAPDTEHSTVSTF
jgi:putative PEP-CTERM system histidine kinase